MQADPTGGPILPANQAGSITSGAGLYRAERPGPFGAGAGWTVGIIALVVLATTAFLLYVLNDSFASGKASGTTDQIGFLGAAPTAVIAPGSPEALGKQVIGHYNCGGCHTIPGIAGATGNIGPNLGGVASRPTIAGGAVQNNGPASLKAWVLDPPANKPGTLMPKLGLSDQEATEVAAYLETLK